MSIFKFLRARRKHPDPEVRLAEVKSTRDLRFLERVALDPEELPELRRTALKTVWNGDALSRILFRLEDMELIRDALLSGPLPAKSATKWVLARFREDSLSDEMMLFCISNVDRWGSGALDPEFTALACAPTHSEEIRVAALDGLLRRRQRRMFRAFDAREERIDEEITIALDALEEGLDQLSEVAHSYLKLLSKHHPPLFSSFAAGTVAGIRSPGKRAIHQKRVIRLQQVQAQWERDLFASFKIASNPAEDLEALKALERNLADLRDEDPLVQARAVQVFVDYPDKQALDPLLDLLRSKHHCAHQNVVRALGNSRSPRATDALLEYLQSVNIHKDPGFYAVELITALGCLGHAQAVAPLSRLALDESSPDLLTALERILADFDSAALIPHAVNLARSPNQDIRVLGVSLLGGVARVEAIQTLATALSDTEREVAAGALESLVHTGDACVETLRGRLDKASGCLEEQRISRALVRLRCPEGIPVLIDAFFDAPTHRYLRNEDEAALRRVLDDSNLNTRTLPLMLDACSVDTRSVLRGSGEDEHYDEIVDPAVGLKAVKKLCRIRGVTADCILTKIRRLPDARLVVLNDHHNSSVVIDLSDRRDCAGAELARRGIMKDIPTSSLLP